MDITAPAITTPARLRPTSAGQGRLGFFDVAVSQHRASAPPAPAGLLCNVRDGRRKAVLRVFGASLTAGVERVLREHGFQILTKPHLVAREVASYQWLYSKGQLTILVQARWEPGRPRRDLDRVVKQAKIFVDDQIASRGDRSLRREGNPNSAFDLDIAVEILAENMPLGKYVTPQPREDWRPRFTHGNWGLVEKICYVLRYIAVVPYVLFALRVGDRRDSEDSRIIVCVELLLTPQTRHLGQGPWITRLQQIWRAYPQYEYFLRV